MTSRLQRWCFVDSAAMDYQVATPDSRPLGGSQSALCYLARSLAARGHRVRVVNRSSEPGLHHGVECFNQDSLAAEFWADQDIIVALSDAAVLARLPAGPARRILWLHHSPSVVEVEALPRQLGAVERIVYVSAWQQAAFQKAIGSIPGTVVANGCSPWFAPLPDEPAAFAALKAGPPTLAYTSNPSRGLHVLIRLFPHLRRLFPHLRLQVFSSLRAYQARPEEEAAYLPLYAACRQLPGVEYFGSIAQPELAKALARAQIWAYPTIYEETFCIAALEAMAAGCLLVATERGALAETTAGYARLVPPSLFELGYFEALSNAIMDCYRAPPDLLPRLQAQSRFALETYSWQRQAAKWEMLGERLIADG
ncbi:MAG TPA: glycosyltransferase family 4 protein [Candidatus Obscuribacterales bacterium]